MTVRVSSGPARVVASGTATCFRGHPLRLSIDDPAPVLVELSFAHDPEEPDVRVDIETQEGLIHLICVNFDKADGRGSAVPLLLGDTDDEELHLHFRVFRYGRTDDRTVHYTLFAVDREDVDWNEGQV